MTDLLRTYSAHHVALRDRTGSLVGQAWDAFGGLDSEAMAKFPPMAVRIVQAARLQQVRLLTAYLAQSRAAAFKKKHPTPIEIDTAGVLADYRNGADIADVYARPIVSARGAISRGGDFAAAMAAGLQRAQTLSITDVLLAQQATMAAATDNTDGLPDGQTIVGYRRVLDGPNPCGLCIQAADETYGSGDLAPIHNNCFCGVAEIYAHHDPAADLNRSTLASADVTGRKIDVGTDGDPIPKGDPPLVVAVHEQGELGPVLADASHAFRGPNDI